MTEEVTFPHCDPRVIHAPGAGCKFCDESFLQKLRPIWNIAFSGEAPKDGQMPCPADVSRGPESYNAWYGNRPYASEEQTRREKFFEEFFANEEDLEYDKKLAVGPVYQIEDVEFVGEPDSEIAAKRLYMNGLKVRGVCTECGTACERDFGEDYLFETSTMNDTFDLGLFCRICDPNGVASARFRTKLVVKLEPAWK